MQRRLSVLSAATGVDPYVGEPFEVWLRLRHAYGRRVTIVDLYELVAARRGIELAALPVKDREELSRAALKVMFSGFQVVDHDGDRRPEPVVLCGYDDRWPLQFDEWRGRAAAALGYRASRIEHVGSTSVPGMSAKPVIDIQVSVPELRDEDAYVPALRSLGVILRSRDRDRRYLRPGGGAPRTVQFHVCAAGSKWERDHVLFRDYLRSSHAARDTYGRAKQETAATWHDDRIAYTEAKTGVILDLLEEAEEWAHRTAWEVQSQSE